MDIKDARKETFKRAEDLLKKVRELETNTEETNTEEKRRLYAETWCVLFTLEGDFLRGSKGNIKEKLHDLFIDIINGTLKNYNPYNKDGTEQPLENYFNYMCKTRKKNVWKREKIQTVNDENVDTFDEEGTGYRLSDTVEYDEWFENESDASQGLDKVERCINTEETIEYVSSVGMIVCKLCKSRNQKKYYPLYYTNVISAYMRFLADEEKYGEIEKMNSAHANQIFDTINCEFLNTYTTEECKTLKEIACVAYKQNKDFGIMRCPEREIKALPLPSPVFCNYIADHFEIYSQKNKNTINSFISKYREQFNEALENAGIIHISNTVQLKND
ncbi:MAG: hypothetical protein E7271_10005 [Lachnospiraceae bacterium]|nr:hypothetical protein [Lachnospiraceae bacterium]